MIGGNANCRRLIGKQPIGAPEEQRALADAAGGLRERLAHYLAAAGTLEGELAGHGDLGRLARQRALSSLPGRRLLRAVDELCASPNGPLRAAADRAEARRAFVQLDTPKRVQRAMLKNASPIDMKSSVGDIVCFRKDNNTGGKTRWSVASRVI